MTYFVQRAPYFLHDALVFKQFRRFASRQRNIEVVIVDFNDIEEKKESPQNLVSMNLVVFQTNKNVM